MYQCLDIKNQASALSKSVGCLEVNQWQYCRFLGIVVFTWSSLGISSRHFYRGFIAQGLNIVCSVHVACQWELGTRYITRHTIFVGSSTNLCRPCYQCVWSDAYSNLHSVHFKSDFSHYSLHYFLQCYISVHAFWSNFVVLFLVSSMSIQFHMDSYLLSNY